MTLDYNCRRSLTAAVAIVIQTALDAGAAYGAFSLSGFLSAADGIPLNWLWSFAATFLGSYFGEQMPLGLRRATAGMAPLLPATSSGRCAGAYIMQSD